MRPLGIAVFLLAATPTGALACSALPADPDRLACYDRSFREVRMIRCTDALGDAICEVLSPGPGDMVSCIAFDAAGAPLGRAAGAAGFGVLFYGLDASRIDHLDCQVAS